MHDGGKRRRSCRVRSEVAHRREQGRLTRAAIDRKACKARHDLVEIVADVEERQAFTIPLRRLVGAVTVRVGLVRSAVSTHHAIRAARTKRAVVRRQRAAEYLAALEARKGALERVAGCHVQRVVEEVDLVLDVALEDRALEAAVLNGRRMGCIERGVRIATEILVRRRLRFFRKQATNFDGVCDAKDLRRDIRDSRLDAVGVAMRASCFVVQAARCKMRIAKRRGVARSIGGRAFLASDRIERERIVLVLGAVEVPAVTRAIHADRVEHWRPVIAAVAKAALVVDEWR